MRHNLLKIILGSCVIFLASCQTTTTSNPVTNMFSFAPPPTELNLAQSVQDALVRSGDPVVGQVHVQTDQNVVVLSGYVKKIRQSDVAEQITRKVPGVSNVVNRIIVRH